MKILQISTELVHSGAEKIVYDLSLDLKSKGHEVQVACVKDIRGEVGEWLEAKGVAVYWMDLNYRKPLGFMVNLLRFIRFVKREKFDLIHAHQFHANVAARLCRIFFRVKIVSSVHLVERRFRPWHFWFDNLTSFLCDKEICVSKAVKNFTSNKVPFIRKKLEVIYNGIAIEKCDLEKDEIRNEIGIPNDLYLFGIVGRLYPQKGYLYLLEAFKKIAISDKNIGLLIVGEGPDRKYIEKYIVDNHLVDQVWLVGYQSDVSKYYHVMNCFVLSSLFEGFGLVLVEALLNKLPIVATEVDSIPEIIKDESLGLLCIPANAEDLAEKMLRQYKAHPRDPQELEKIALYAIAEFSLDKMCQKHLDLYESLLK